VVDHSEQPTTDITINVQAAVKVASSASAKVWAYYNFSHEWFDDALNEARNGRNYNARRREIIFAVCFAESYIFEWVRDEVIRGDFDKINDYFKPGSNKGVLEKWKDIPKQLAGEKLICAAPNIGTSYWQEWDRLVKYRNGLIHARASRPETHSQPDDEKPLPSKAILDQLTPGWAVRVVVALVKNLHTVVQTSPPEWLVDP